VGAAGTDLVLLPDGGFLLVGGGPSYNRISRLSPPPDLQVIWESPVLPNNYLTCHLAPDGTIYLAAYGLATFDLSTNTINHIGDFPSTINSVEGLFFWNGQLRATGFDSNFEFAYFNIDITNPDQSTFWDFQDNFMPLGEGGFFNGTEGFYSPNFLNNRDIYFYDPATDTETLVCQNTGDIGLQGSHFVANSSPSYACVCLSDAGALPQPGPFSACANENLSFSPATSTVLDNNDLLRYMLFSNLSDTLGSILATNTTPTFSFNPATMQTGVTYYAAAIAGNTLNGNVDLTDPCLDISNAAQLLWRPLPTVAFSAANPNVCAGACTSVTATFTGTAPFALTYTTPASGTVTQTFSGNTGTFQVCTLPGSPPGSLALQATKVVDAWCMCE
jgi:hypothetical protein